MDTLSPKPKKRVFLFINQRVTAWQGMYRTIHRMYRTEKNIN
jgi:hypothetical protein